MFPTAPTTLQRKAAALAARPGAVCLRADGSYRVRSAAGGTSYLVNAAATTCTCPAGQRSRRVCYHRLACRAVAKAIAAAQAARAAGTLDDLRDLHLSLSFTDDFAGHSATVVWRACQMVAQAQTQVPAIKTFGGRLEVAV